VRRGYLEVGFGLSVGAGLNIFNVDDVSLISIGYGEREQFMQHFNKLQGELRPSEGVVNDLKDSMFRFSVSPFIFFSNQS
jgi:hypothetical protein